MSPGTPMECTMDTATAAQGGRDEGTGDRGGQELGWVREAETLMQQNL